MCNCAFCDLASAPPPSATLCGPPPQQPTLTSNQGLRQYPLLHLVYQLSLQLAALEPRKVRATWRKGTVRKSGSIYYPPVRFDIGKVENEAQQFLGMLLAQRVRFLPVLAQAPRALQQQMVNAAVDLLKSEARVPEILSRLDLTFARLDGTLSDPFEIQLAEERLADLKKRRADLEELSKPDKMYEHVLASYKIQRQQLTRYVTLEHVPEEFQAELQKFFSYQTYRKQLIEQWLGTSGYAPPTEMQVEYGTVCRHLDWLQRMPETYFRGILEAEQQQIELQQDRLRELLQNQQDPRWQQALERNRLDSLDLYFETIAQEVELDRLREAANQDAQALQKSLQVEYCNGDAALTDANYPPGCEASLVTLRQTLTNSAAARQVFLYLHPRLKYHADPRLRCRLALLLSDATFIQRFEEADQARLLQPGPYARMGAFIINSLVPGSYDDRHRGLVQREIEEISLALDESGETVRIACHSCGAEQFGTAENPVWVRDHNPPTRFVKIANSKPNVNVLGDLGLARYGGSQILLPHCLRCSTDQSSITRKVGELIESGQVANWGQLASALSADELRAYLRLVCSPGIGWYARSGGGNLVAQILGRGPDNTLLPPNARAHPGADRWAGWLVTALQQSRVNPADLVTTGKTGSFAGINEELLAAMGSNWGCHTCVTPAPQTNPFAGMSWIADHQPPTALVERGLMELPQIVLPHCHRCSSRQSQAVNKLCKAVDACFDTYPETGEKRWKEYWCALIREAGFTDL